MTDSCSSARLKTCHVPHDTLGGNSGFHDGIGVELVEWDKADFMPWIQPRRLLFETSHMRGQRGWLGSGR